MSKILTFAREEVAQVFKSDLNYLLINSSSTISDEAWLMSELDKLTPIWKERNEVEEDTNYIQPIAYIIVTDGYDNIFVYKRSGGGESRLDGKLSVGFGGHVELEDEGETVCETLKNSAIREIEEELGISFKEIDEFNFDGLFYISDETANDVDKVHMALFMSFEDGGQDFNLYDGGNGIGWMSLQAAKNLNFHTDLFETWSKLSLKEIVDW